ncbi:TPA: alveolar soft part sarcoma chromosome region, candidate 1-like [Bos taurus]|nr:TPA: alveolar soft part sarcoma chromosome region, candidate 1-like [Bos taurus]
MQLSPSRAPGLKHRSGWDGITQDTSVWPGSVGSLSIVKVSCPVVSWATPGGTTSRGLGIVIAEWMGLGGGALVLERRGHPMPHPGAWPRADRGVPPGPGEKKQAWPAELPDEFYEVTAGDVRRRLAQLKSERKRLEEAPLVTKAFREAQMKEKLQRYPKVVLRVLFPDRYILQGFFRPSETVGDLRDFVRSHLGNPELPFYLFIAPPKTILDDHTLTLFQANLFPTALVHFGPEEPTGSYLEPRLLEHTVSPSAADVLVARCVFARAGGHWCSAASGTSALTPSFQVHVQGGGKPAPTASP